MADFISDEDMEKISSGNKQESPDFIPDEKMDMLLYQAENGGSTAGETAVKALNPLNWPKNMAAGLEKIDEYTGAPIRKAVTELATGSKLDRAPTGKEQAKLMGFSDKSYNESLNVGDEGNIPVVGELSPAGVMGFGLDVVQDPLLLLAEAARPLKTLFESGKDGVAALKAKGGGKGFQSQAAEGSADAAANASATIEVKPLSVRNEVKLFRERPPQTLEELRNWAPAEGQSDLVGKTRLREIDTNVADLNTRPLKYHYTMMENPKAMKQMKLEFEALPTEDAQKIASYNQAMVNEAESKIRSTINDLVPYSQNEAAQGAVRQPKTLPDAGLDLIAKTKSKYNQEKESLAPLFNELRQADPLSKEESQGLIQAIAENTKLNKLLTASKEGRLVLNKNMPRTGISDEEQRVLARVVDDLNDGVTFKELQDIREFLRKYIDPANPSAMSEVGKVRSILLDQMEHLSGQFGKSTKDVFKQYAVNERSRENIEKIIGGQIESLDQIYAANPDKIVNKVFSNPNYADLIRKYLGDDAIGEMAAAKLRSGLESAYDSAKGFQPHTFKRWLNTNKTFVSRYVDQAATQRLNDLADYGYYGRRFLDDVNPSGTAAALLKSVEPGDIATEIIQKGMVGTATSQTAGRVKSALKQRQAQKFFAEAIGEAPKNSDPGMINKALQFNPDRSLMLMQQSVAPQATIRSQYANDQGPQPMPMTKIEKAKLLDQQRKLNKGKLPRGM